MSKVKKHKTGKANYFSDHYHDKPAYAFSTQKLVKKKIAKLAAEKLEKEKLREEEYWQSYTKNIGDCFSFQPHYYNNIYDLECICENMYGYQEYGIVNQILYNEYIYDIPQIIQIQQPTKDDDGISVEYISD